MEKGFPKALLTSLMLLATFCFFVAMVYGANTPVQISISASGTIFKPNPATVGDGDTVTWNSDTTIFIPMPAYVRVIVPTGSFQFSDYNPTGGFDSGLRPIGTGIPSPPLNWKPGVNQVKYTVEIYDNNGQLMRTEDPYLQHPPGVGGIVVSVDKFGLLAPYIGLASTILVTTAATAIYVKRVKRRKEKQ